jgi:hypothetical protein
MRKNFDAFHKEAQETVAALEAAYDEKLRLDKPAKYWEDLATEYRRNGLRWFVAAGAVVVFLAGCVFFFLYWPPEVLREKELTAGGVKAALLIAVVASMVIYLIALCARMATSAYHLSRDAKERLQLTHVFLALLKDQKIDAKERELVLSALFSRSDTGLLKHDASPTFPGALGPLVNAIRGKM